MLKHTWPLVILLASLIATLPTAGRPLAQPPQQQLDFSFAGGGLIGVGSAPLSPGGKLTINAVVKRLGQLGATQIAISLQPGGRRLSVASVPPGPEGTRPQSLSALLPKDFKPGSYRVRLQIDPNNQVKESNEGNNIYNISRAFQVAQP